MKALDGLRVLDLTRLLPGAVATKQLVDWGAEVIKIEPPGTGDYARSMNPPLFARTNSGKKSVVLDLKTTSGADALRALARTADILVEGNRPGVMERLGLGDQALAKENERLIFVSITGYGQTGPWAGLAGHDINYIALGGMLGLNLPVIPGVQIADLVGGSIQAVTGILLALLERARTGRGQFVDVSMLAGVLSLLPIPLAQYNATGRDPKPGKETLNGAFACYQIYEAADGRSLAVGALEPKFWQELCRRLGCEELTPLQFSTGGEQAGVKQRVAAIFKTKSADLWFETLRDSDCCVTPVRTVAEIAAELPPWAGPPAPQLGEHTEEILEALGLTA
jgi:crotonobetainyl-CoA:carnitine CoA-transferase CaiB-like acyl-CoA transferase